MARVSITTYTSLDTRIFIDDAFKIAEEHRLEGDASGIVHFRLVEEGSSILLSYGMRYFDARNHSEFIPSHVEKGAYLD